MTTFGALLRRYRLHAGLAQNAVARMTGINVGSINRFERDLRLPATRAQVVQLATALHVSREEKNNLLFKAGMSCRDCQCRYERHQRQEATRTRWKRWASLRIAGGA